MEAEVINQLNNTLNDLEKRSEDIRVYMDYQGKKDRLEEVIGLSEDPELWNDPKRAQEIGKERKILEGIVLTLDNIASGIEDNRMLIEMAVEENDEEGFAAVQEDVAGLEKQMADLEFKRMFNQPADPNNCFIDITAGAGGTEAEDWAGMLFRMYSRYAERNRWQVEIVSANESELGGYKEVIARIIGLGAYSRLKFESGGHRVQRVPATESQGRIHTSACTVAVMPEADELEDIELNPADLRIDTFRASGAGGQHINKTDSAVRITHLPTGMVVECQDGRSQHANKAQAMKVLAARLNDAQKREAQAKEAAERKSLIGSGDRSERIRTYNYPQGRVTDHRINLTLHKLDFVMDGDLEEITNALIAEHQAELLAAMGD